MLAGKVCYITGGTSGLGKAAAARAAAEGAKVVITGRREERGAEVVKELKEAGGEASYFKCDVQNPTEVKESIKFCVDTYGSIDLCFNK